MRSNYPRPYLAEEMRQTAEDAQWREHLLSDIRGALGSWKSWADKVGTGKNEMQIRFVEPINAQFSFKELNLKWVQFRVLSPQKKEDTTQVVRFGPDTAICMVLVKVPRGTSFKWLALARRKYQFAGKDLFIEFSRGWIKDSTDNPGVALFKRDFPGLVESSQVAKVTEHSMGKPVWENNAQYANKISYHLVVVELSQEMENSEIQKLLTDSKIAQEYPGEKTEDFNGHDLQSSPMVYDIEEVAKHLNAHLKNDEDKLAFFGENYSISIWSRFLSLWGSQFPHLLPKQAVTI